VAILDKSESGEYTDAGLLEPKGPSEAGHEKAVEDAPVPLDEVSGDDFAEPAEPKTTDLFERRDPEPSLATLVQPSISYPEPEEPSTTRKPASSPNSLSADMCNVDGKISVLVHPPRGLRASPSALKFILGGEQILEPEVSAVDDDGCYLVDIRPSAGFRTGNLTITFA